MSMNMRALHVRLCFINAFVLFYPLKLQQVLVHYLLFFSNVFFLREFTILYAVVKVLLVGSSGLEPPTSRLSGARSNQLSYEPVCCLARFLSASSPPFTLSLSALVEMKGIEPLTPCLQGRCSPS